MAYFKVPPSVRNYEHFRILSLGRDSNPGPAEYEIGVLSTQLRG